MALRRVDHREEHDVTLVTLKLRSVPRREPVTIELTPSTTGDIAFACGMDMLKGRLIVQ